MRRDNRTGVPGVSWQTQTRRWKVMIGNRYVGVFKDFADAVAARREEERKAR